MFSRQIVEAEVVAVQDLRGMVIRRKTFEPRVNYYPVGRAASDRGQDRQGLFLFANPRAAKRQCGRSQRVIKVPDTTVFERTSSSLLKRGITRLVMEGTVVALDA